MTGGDFRKFNKLRRYVFAWIKKLYRKTGRKHSRDGLIRLIIEYPDYENQEASLYYRIELECHAIGSSKTYSWGAEDLGLAIEQAYRDLDYLIERIK